MRRRLSRKVVHRGRLVFQLGFAGIFTLAPRGDDLFRQCGAFLEVGYMFL